MTLTPLAPTVTTCVEPWRQWQLAYAGSSRKVTSRARLVFTVILTALGAWLALQLVASRGWV